MRKTVAFLLVVLVLGIFSPVSFTFSFSGGRSMLVTLDVCHAHAVSLSCNADVPVIAEALVIIPADFYTASFEVSSPRFQDLFTPFLKEDPPKA